MIVYKMGEKLQYRVTMFGRFKQFDTLEMALSFVLENFGSCSGVDIRPVHLMEVEVPDFIPNSAPKIKNV